MPLPLYDRLKMRFGFTQQVRDAADQFWGAVKRGATIEVPIIFNAKDPSMQAVFLLFKQHPEMRLIVRQSRSFILTLLKNTNISDDTKELMLKGRQFGHSEEFLSSIQSMLGQQEEFLVEQGLDPAQMEKDAQTAQAAKHRMTVEAGETMAVTLSDEAVSITSEATPESTP